MFSTRINIRITPDQAKLINIIVKANPQKYDSTSIFLRTAIIKLIREELPRKEWWNDGL